MCKCPAVKWTSKIKQSHDTIQTPIKKFSTAALLKIHCYLSLPASDFANSAAWHQKCIHIELIEMRFWCAFKMNQIECTLNAHWYVKWKLPCRTTILNHQKISLFLTKCRIKSKVECKWYSWHPHTCHKPFSQNIYDRWNLTSIMTKNVILLV